MTATRAEVVRVVVVTDDTTRAEIAETLGLFNDNAKRIRRRGHIGVASVEYDRQHARIDALLEDYWSAKP